MGELNVSRILKRGLLYPNHQAVVDLGNGHEANYAEHIARVSQLCRAITSLGVSPTDRVGVLAGSSHAYVELWQACLAGVAVINPLNTRLAAEEYVYILNDSGTEVIFVDGTFAPVIASLRERLPHLRTRPLQARSGCRSTWPSCWPTWGTSTRAGGRPRSTR